MKSIVAFACLMLTQNVLVQSEYPAKWGDVDARKDKLVEVECIAQHSCLVHLSTCFPAIEIQHLEAFCANDKMPAADYESTHLACPGYEKNDLKVIAMFGRGHLKNQFNERDYSFKVHSYVSRGEQKLDVTTVWDADPEFKSLFERCGDYTNFTPELVILRKNIVAKDLQTGENISDKGVLNEIRDFFADPFFQKMYHAHFTKMAEQCRPRNSLWNPV